jgi:large subunit ribosomal protein L25
MESKVLKATRRTVIGKQVRALRRQGLLPAVLYGSGIEPTPVEFNLKEATYILLRAASSTLVAVELDGEKHMTLVRERQKNYIRNELTHVDLQVVSMKEKLRVRVPLEMTGESFAIKNFNGILVVNLNEIEVECLPQDLPNKILVDLALLKQIGDAICVRDIAVSDKLEVLNDVNDVVAVVTGQAAEEVVITEPAVPEPEVIEKGKKEEEEAA